MTKKIFLAVFISIATASAVCAQVTMSGKQPKIIDPFSDSYQNATMQSSSSNATGSIAVNEKYVPTFGADINNTTSLDAQNKTAADLQKWEQAVITSTNNTVQKNVTAQANITADDFIQNYKVLKSK